MIRRREVVNGDFATNGLARLYLAAKQPRKALKILGMLYSEDPKNSKTVELILESFLQLGLHKRPCYF